MLEYNSWMPLDSRRFRRGCTLPMKAVFVFRMARDTPENRFFDGFRERP
jgi:hypothetical protein